MLFSGLAFQTAKFTHSHKSEAIMKKEKKGWTRSPQTCLCVSLRLSVSEGVFLELQLCVFVSSARNLVWPAVSPSNIHPNPVSQ